MTTIDRFRAMRPSRRRVLMAAGAAVVTGAAPALAQQQLGPPPHQQGPAVFRDYDQVELDAAYDQSVYAPLGQQITRRFASNSEATRDRVGDPMRVAYGGTEIEKLDIYQAKQKNSPIHIFIHGGAWRGGAAKDYAFPAEMFVTAGVHYVVPDFIAAENAGGNLMTMADQVRRAIAWTYNNAVNFGGDPRRIQLSGHSSGAHLAGVALVTDWKKIFGLPPDIIRAGLLISGMYDLKPVRLSARSSYVKFDDASEDALSTQRHIDMLRTPLVVAYGTNETPEFQRQSRDFAAAVKAAGKPVQLLVGDDYNHFEMMETLANPYALAGRAALAQLRTLRS
jgi:arylformamidase